MLDGALAAGDSRVNGNGAPRATPNACIEICLAATASIPSTPPCTGADRVLGGGGTNASGQFVDGSGAPGIPLAQPLINGQCIYAFDECADVTSAVSCARLVTPMPLPTLSPRNLGVLTGLLSLLGWLGMRRERRM